MLLLLLYGLPSPCPSLLCYFVLVIPKYGWLAPSQLVVEGSLLASSSVALMPTAAHAAVCELERRRADSASTVQQ
eukprot:67685-Chlamydomonas_euryale.AAC.2